jgi:hypothetical protein
MRPVGHPVGDKAARQRYIGSSIWFNRFCEGAHNPQAGAEVPVSVDNLAKVIEPA